MLNLRRDSVDSPRALSPSNAFGLLPVLQTAALPNMVGGATTAVNVSNVVVVDGGMESNGAELSVPGRLATHVVPNPEIQPQIPGWGVPLFVNFHEDYVDQEIDNEDNNESSNDEEDEIGAYVRAGSVDTDEEELHNMLNGLILYGGHAPARAVVSKTVEQLAWKLCDFNIYPEDDDYDDDYDDKDGHGVATKEMRGVSETEESVDGTGVDVHCEEPSRTKNKAARTDQAFIERYIAVDKSSSEERFYDKLKHVFILSTAGKPIYSLNGSDLVIMGYMGLISTIVSSFEENEDDNVRSITYDDAKIVVVNRNPLILVAVTTIGYEKMQLRALASTASPAAIPAPIPVPAPPAALQTHSQPLLVGSRHGASSQLPQTQQLHHARLGPLVHDASILLRQMSTLYDYLISMISKPVLVKSFRNRMNYDLRKILTAADFINLDSLAMHITYGAHIKALSAGTAECETATGTGAGTDAGTAADCGDARGFGIFVTELLDSALECVRLTHTTRTKLNNILLSTKKLKLRRNSSASVSGLVLPPAPSADTLLVSDVGLAVPRAIASATAAAAAAATSATTGYISFLGGSDPDMYLGENLLFGILLDKKCSVMAAMKPKNHSLKNEDLKILLTTISNQQSLSQPGDEKQDLWIPICMPHFNNTGFLYAYVRTVSLYDSAGDDQTAAEDPVYITVVLLSSSKNAFFHMQEVAKYLEYRLNKSAKLRGTLYRELSHTEISIFRDIKVPQIRHFLYKLIGSNQFVSSDVAEFQPQNSLTSSILQLVYFYSTLHNTRATPLRRPESGLGSSRSASSSHSASKKKKLTYVKYFSRQGGAGTNMIGFMLSSDTYEFYCLCGDGSMTTQLLISHSLQIIRWCEKFHKRLFIDAGAVF